MDGGRRLDGGVTFDVGAGLDEELFTGPEAWPESLFRFSSTIVITVPTMATIATMLRMIGSREVFVGGGPKPES